MSGILKKSNNDAIKRAIELVNWNSLFSRKNVHEQVVIFNQTLINIFSNYIPNKFITIDDKDPPTTNFVSNVSLSSIQFRDQDILKIICSHNYNKAHGYDDISIRLLEICDSSFVKPLSIIFKNCLQTGIFPNNWKKSNVVPIHKKGDKQLLQNYRPVSLLPICSNIFEKIIFNLMLEFLEENSLLCPHQSGFRSSDSCQSQLLSIVHGIYANFDQSPTLGVPQGSILGPLLFLIYINDLPEALESSVKLLADDTSLFSTVYDPNMSADQLDKDLKKKLEWAYKWKIIFNSDSSKPAQEVIFSRKTNKINHPTITFNTVPVARAPCQKHVGLYLDEKLNFNHHINVKISKTNKGIGIIKRLSHILQIKSLIQGCRSVLMNGTVEIKRANWRAKRA